MKDKKEKSKLKAAIMRGVVERASMDYIGGWPPCIGLIYQPKHPLADQPAHKDVSQPKHTVSNYK